MARMNIYLPDELAGRAKQSDLNISKLAQDAVKAALAAQSVEEWLRSLEALPQTGVSHAEVVEAVAAAKDEFDRA